MFPTIPAASNDSIMIQRDRMMQRCLSTVRSHKWRDSIERKRIENKQNENNNDHGGELQLEAILES